MVGRQHRTIALFFNNADASVVISRMIASWSLSRHVYSRPPVRNSIPWCRRPPIWSLRSYWGVLRLQEDVNKDQLLKLPAWVMAPIDQISWLFPRRVCHEFEEFTITSTATRVFAHYLCRSECPRAYDRSGRKQWDSYVNIEYVNSVLISADEDEWNDYFSIHYASFRSKLNIWLINVIDFSVSREIGRHHLVRLCQAPKQTW